MCLSRILPLVGTLAFGGKTENDIHFFVTKDQAKSLLFVGTLGGLSTALSNQKGSVPEKFRTTLVLHGKPQFWISLVVPEVSRAQIGAAAALEPFGAGSSALGSAASLALSCNFGTELTSQLTVDFAKPEGAAYVMQLASPANATPPDWTKSFTVSTKGLTVVITNKTTVKEIEGLVETATKPTGPVPAGK